MFQWLSGAQGDVDASNPNDQPDTPAHVFAARAFKYSIFGTPKPRNQRKASSIVDMAAAPDDLVSPCKPNGILLTPGIPTLRRSKSVTFGAQVKDKQTRRTLRHSKSGLPTTCPGKFPSPWTPKVDEPMQEAEDESAKSQTKFTKALYDARSEMKKDLVVMEGGNKTEKQTAVEQTTWKQRYEDYAERTQREMKKLIAKQRAAKCYARDKDSKVMDLAEKLRQEQKKVHRLEAQVAQLNAQLEGFQNNAQQKSAPSPGVFDSKSISTRLKTSTAVILLPPTEAASHEASPTRSRRPVSGGDLWADAMLSSPAVAASQRASSRKATPRSRLQNKANPSPLVARDINTIHQRTTPRREHNEQRQPQTLIDSGDDMDMPDLPVPSPAEQSSIRSKPQVALKSQISPIRQPQKPNAAMSSPFMTSPPQYDRLALPFSMPSPAAKSRATANPVPVRELKSAVSAVVAELGDKENAAPEKGGRGAEKEGGEEKEKPRRELDEERRAKAAARIAARRMMKVGGGVAA